jgi:hypothetical protein
MDLPENPAFLRREKLPAVQVGRVKKPRNTTNLSSKYKRDLKHSREKSKKNPSCISKGSALKEF